MIRTFAFAAVFALSTNAYAQETSSVPLGDEVFLMKAYCEGMAEVAKSKLACEKATQPAIKAFAEQMVKDHSECNNKIAEVARQKSIPLSSTPSAVHTVALTRLSKMSGSDFDKAYLMAQMCAHVEAIRLFEHESCKGECSEIKELATQAIPKLQGHAKEVFEIAGEKAEYQKFCKIQDFAKQVMSEK
jgi:putative membrane protein